MYYKLFTFISFALISLNLFSQDKSDWIGGYPDACTSTVDGSVITSHTDDSHRTQSSVNIVPQSNHSEKETCKMYKRVACDTTVMPSYANILIGEIPQVETTYGFINSAYPCMNEKQLAIGESTFGGRDELQSDKCLIDCQRLCQLMLERCTTAREAIKMADELTKLYGWSDYGECLTIADTKEVWHFEIVGPCEGKVGAVWVAQRVPDDHVSVNANASRIRQIDLEDTEFYMASENIFDVAKQNNWWNEEDGEFEFCYAYSPESRMSVAATRREWRVLDLFAPSLKLDPNADDYPFSVKPDTLITLEKIVSVFKDYYENTPYDMTRNILDDNGEISALANPFMPYDELEIMPVSGGWYDVDHESGEISFLGERTIARWYTMYGTITQSRSWLPDEIGGVVWFALDNIATSVYIPIYCGVTDLPQCYETDGRLTGLTRESAWWAFNYTGTLAAQRWGDMHSDVDAVWNPVQKELFQNQADFEKQALEIKKIDKRKEFLTSYTMKWGETVVTKSWKLGDFLFTKYDEKF